MALRQLEGEKRAADARAAEAEQAKRAAEARAAESEHAAHAAREEAAALRAERQQQPSVESEA